MTWRSADLSECYKNTIKTVNLNDWEAHRLITMLEEHNKNN